MKSLLIFCTSITLAFSTTLFAQPSNELGILGGASYYTGDLNPYTHFPAQQTYFGFAVQHRHNLNPRVSWSNVFTYLEISGDDALSDDAWRQNRNLSFTSNVFELASRIEFNYFKYDVYEIERTFTPYSFIGLGLFWFNPIAELNGNLYELQPQRTEGQIEPYSRLQLNIPFGFGFKFKITERLNFNAEWGLRRLFTDYLDDVSTQYPDSPQDLNTIAVGLSNKALAQDGVNGSNWGSQRGNSNTRDWYGFAGIGISLRLTENPSACHFNPMNL